jgi:YbbR domain-containing protein
MAFRETDGRGGDGARGVAARWFHALLFEDWSLKLLALLITLGLWYAVTGQRTPATLRLRGVQLEFVRPQEMEISNEPLDEVEVTLQGSRGKLDELNARNLVVRADVSQLKPGDRVVRLLPRQNVSMDLPDGIEIVRIEPGSVAIRLERSIEREVEVEARFEGSPPEGYVRGAVQITPPTVRVRGPESHVNALEKAHTESISLDGQRESLTLPQTAIDITDQKVVPLEPVVTVRVEISEEIIQKRFAGIVVRSANGEGAQVSPATAAVEIRGERSVVERLRPEELEIVVEQAADGSTLPRLSMPPGLGGRIELVTTSPTRFSIEK